MNIFIVTEAGQEMDQFGEALYTSTEEIPFPLSTLSSHFRCTLKPEAGRHTGLFTQFKFAWKGLNPFTELIQRYMGTVL